MNSNNNDDSFSNEMNKKRKNIAALIKNSQKLALLKANIISRVRDIKKREWSFYDDARDIIDEYVWTYTHPSTKRATPLAYATKSRQGGVFEIYVNKHIPSNARTSLELHEMGHVIFTHVSFPDTQRDIILKKILSFWPRIKLSISDDVLEKYSPHALANMIAQKILNIAMDMEVNSRLFSEEEYIPFMDACDIAYIYACVGSILSDERRLTAIESWLNNTSPKKGHLFHPILPVEYGYPSGLEFNQYIDIILNQPKEFFKKLKEQMDEMNRNQGRGSGSSNGMGDEDDLDSCDSQEGTGGKLSQDDIDQMRESYNDGDNEENQKERDEAERESDEIDEEMERQRAEEKGEKTEKNMGDVSQGMAISKRAKHVAEGFTPVGHAKLKTDIIDVDDTQTLARTLLNLTYNIKKVIQEPNFVYYYNRRKYNSNILITKYIEKDLYRPGNIVIVADSSGSINSEAIMKLANVIKGIASRCGKKSRLIWYDTAVSGDMLLRKGVYGPDSTGGTDIASGIDYASRYLKKSTDKLIVISDYADSLYSWYKSLKKIKHDCIGLCWKEREQYPNMHVKEYLKKVSYSDRDTDDLIGKLLEKMPTILVNV